MKQTAIELMNELSNELNKQRNELQHLKYLLNQQTVELQTTKDLNFKLKQELYLEKKITKNLNKLDKIFIENHFKSPNQKINITMHYTDKTEYTLYTTLKKAKEIISQTINIDHITINKRYSKKSYNI